MILNKEALQAIFTDEQIAKSTYTTREGEYIRLINSSPKLATIPALYPNLLNYRSDLKQYENVKLDRVDYDNGQPSGNRKTDMKLNYEPIDLNNLPPLPKASND